jgi:alpha-amylase/alpha-mannosidase (GH57 family)
MFQPRKLYLCLYWHMHQPDYRDFMSGEFVLPWTYLHAMKDYTDMAYHFEKNRAAKGCFNFVPVLLDQLEDYALQFKTGNMRDPLLALLKLADHNTVTPEQRKLILDSCFRCNHATMLTPFPHFNRLFNIYRTLQHENEDVFAYLSGQYLADLLVWYHLSWIGESIRRTSELVARLMAKGYDYTPQERYALFDLIGEIITGLIPRYRKLVENGQIEISTTPHYHPILPLLLDFNSAREAAADMPLPVATRYPGGLTRSKRHIESAISSHLERFGQAPKGVWPAEGGVSQAALMLLAKQGFQWGATGEGVLANSLRHAYGDQALSAEKYHLYKPYRVSDGQNALTMFFRDDRLSDKIGFEYSKWYGRDAVNDFVHELEQILHRHPEGSTPVVSIILDGENAWEYYPYNGYYFLSELYDAVAAHADIDMATFSDITQMLAPVAKMDAAAETMTPPAIVSENLPGVVAGSWVYGTFSTWIGDPAKNRAWDLLCEAKQSFDRVMADGLLNEEEKRAAEQQLADCEGSDWFWWFGDYNPSHSVASFDLLFRRNLSNLYRLLKLPIPAALGKVISAGGGNAEAGGTMRRGQE